MEYVLVILACAGVLLLWINAFIKTFRTGDYDSRTRLWFLFFATLFVDGALFVIYVLPEFYCSPYLCNFGALVLSILAAGLITLVVPIVLLAKLSSGQIPGKETSQDK